ncbi:hypothetical protein [Gynurincola endophyticus]|jgi:hypothetical protein|uniref:hypothetical protein n=1 Tax=Gynurincola endophyticus TaxID=2479004 RepID=UPI000F8F6FE1|nr:hypothetical protein [Gynurincola endophyticus]
MKNIYILVVFFLLVSASVSAQNDLKVADLKGKWTMVAFDMGGIYYDWINDSIRLPEHMSSQVEAKDLAETKKKIKSNLTPYTKGELEITDNRYIQTLLGDTRAGDYTLIKKDGFQQLRVVNDVDDLMEEELIDFFIIMMIKDILVLKYIDEAEESEALLYFKKDQ